jgi:hydroxyquinol 1,2-dioxygenase
MATDFTEETAADAVVESFAATADPRLRELLSSLVRHLHAFVRDTEPTIAEWQRAIDFLTATGQKCDSERQEFILLSDVLGISMLVETINNRKTAGATESTVLGPFHMVTSPRRALGDTIDLVGTGPQCVLEGRVLSADGPVGTLLEATKRHPYRPAHIHFIVTAPGHRPLTTHIFVAGSPYIESDAVFAVKKSLITEFTPADDPNQPARANFDIVLQPES